MVRLSTLIQYRIFLSPNPPDIYLSDAVKWALVLSTSLAQLLIVPDTSYSFTELINFTDLFLDGKEG